MKVMRIGRCSVDEMVSCDTSAYTALTFSIMECLRKLESGHVAIRESVGVRDTIKLRL